MVAQAGRPSFIELYTPKIFTVLREGYGLDGLKADAISGLTVAIVALPLSMAIAIASGVSPERGLYASIVGGLIVSGLGGSRFQIGGPAGAFIVLVAATGRTHGLDGLILATFLSGIFLVLIGLLRIGTFIKYIPYPVTVGFTSGIAVIIFSSQIKDLLGLTLSGPEPGPLVPKLEALWQALPTTNPAAVAIAVASIAIIVALRVARPRWPGFLIAVVLAGLAAGLLALPAETIGSRFGEIPRSLPWPQLPNLSWDKIVEVLPSALAFTLLGSIESLLSAVVADSMSGRRHRSNAELVAQGFANMGSALFGGICVTGTIARTATNVRAGARGPVSGMLHSVFVLLFLLVAAPLASYIPLATLSAILAVVCWNMAERRQFATLVRSSWGDAVVLIVTFLLVIFRDLSQGIVVGFLIGTLLFVHRMAQSVAVEAAVPEVGEDMADTAGNGSRRRPYDPSTASDKDVIVYRITGAFFFGAAASVSAVIDRLGEHPKAYVVDFSAVPLIDSTAVAAIKAFAEKAQRGHAALFLSGAAPAVRKILKAHGVRPPLVAFRATIGEAIAAAHETAANPPPPAMVVASGTH
jgi:SulP family sulfate permease